MSRRAACSLGRRRAVGETWGSPGGEVQPGAQVGREQEGGEHPHHAVDGRQGERAWQGGAGGLVWLLLATFFLEKDYAQG